MQALREAHLNAMQALCRSHLCAMQAPCDPLLCHALCDLQRCAIQALCEVYLCALQALCDWHLHALCDLQRCAMQALCEVHLCALQALYDWHLRAMRALWDSHLNAMQTLCDSHLCATLKPAPPPPSWQPPFPPPPQTQPPPPPPPRPESGLRVGGIRRMARWYAPPVVFRCMPFTKMKSEKKNAIVFFLPPAEMQSHQRHGYQIVLARGEIELLVSGPAHTCYNGRPEHHYSLLDALASLFTEWFRHLMCHVHRY